jgi:hypothetical protein
MQAMFLDFLVVYCEANPQDFRDFLNEDSLFQLLNKMMRSYQTLSSDL